MRLEIIPEPVIPLTAVPKVVESPGRPVDVKLSPVISPQGKVETCESAQLTELGVVALLRYRRAVPNDDEYAQELFKNRPPIMSDSSFTQSTAWPQSPINSRNGMSREDSFARSKPSKPQKPRVNNNRDRPKQRQAGRSPVSGPVRSSAPPAIVDPKLMDDELRHKKIRATLNKVGRHLTCHAAISHECSSHIQQDPGPYRRQRRRRFPSRLPHIGCV